MTSLTTIRARYAGECAVTGRPYGAGAAIAKVPGSGWALWDATTQETLAAAAAAPIRIERGEGYGGHPYHAGQVVRETWRDRSPGIPKRVSGIVFVLAAIAHYVAEDGLSFGVGDESGSVYVAYCRLATDEEAAPLLAAEAAARQDAANRARVREIARTIDETGARPDPAAGQVSVAGIILLDTQTLYGGGDWFVLDAEGTGPQGAPAIWHVRNNGADGDFWAANNVRTGGAGAIGAWVPFDPDLAAELARLHTATREG